MAKFKNLVDELRRKRQSGEVSIEKIEEQTVVIPDVKDEDEKIVLPVEKAQIEETKPTVKGKGKRGRKK